MVRVLIPSHYDCKSRSGQAYTVYCLEVYYNGKCSKLQRRYRDFHNLHKEMRKTGLATPLFPPKKVRNLSSKLIEQRRQALEVYLQGVLRGERLPAVLVDFLGLPEEAAYSYNHSHLVLGGGAMDVAGCDSSDEGEDELSHQPVIGFTGQLTAATTTVASTARPGLLRGQVTTESSQVSSPGTGATATHGNSAAVGHWTGQTTMVSPGGGVGGATHSRHSSSGSSLADIVLKGTLDALYSTNEEEFYYAGV